MALLNNVFTGTSDATLATTRHVLQQYIKEPLFPAEAISAELAKSGRLTQFNDQAITNFLDIWYGEREAFLALSLLYDDNAWGTMTYHQDHIFPQSLFDRQRLEEAGLPPEQQLRYRQLMNRLGNLELLSGPENIEKSNQDFAKWVTTRNTGFKQRHLIPDDPTLLRLDHFEQFIAAREESDSPAVDHPVRPRFRDCERGALAMKDRPKTTPAVETYKHQDTRANIPTEELRPFAPDDDSHAMLYPRDPSLDPQLVWKGKDEQDRADLAVPVLPVYIQEKIQPLAIIEQVRAAAKKPEYEMASLFGDFNGISFEQMIDFYQHQQHWTNRMILGDSMLVMSSLAEKEGLKSARSR